MAEEASLAVISVAARIPEFWVELPRLWFAQFEAAVNPQKQSDEVKFQLAVGKLGRDVILQVADMMYGPSEERSYSKLKDRLIEIYEESPERQFQRLVGELDLGTQKPSQLLRRMNQLARNCKASEDTVQNLWLARLPSSVKAVLAASQDQKLENLAGIADKVLESLGSNGNAVEVAAACNQNTSAAVNDTMTELLTQVNKLGLEVASLRQQVSSGGQQTYRGRPPNRGRQFRTRSPSRTPASPDWVCRYHYQYGPRAKRCKEPCNWKPKTSGN